MQRYAIAPGPEQAESTAQETPRRDAKGAQHREKVVVKIMEPDVWLERLAAAVGELVNNVEIVRIDNDTLTVSREGTVCTIHVYGQRTAGVVVSQVGAGVGAEGVAHDEMQKEAVDDLSLITLPRAIAASLNT